ncbi:flagellar FliJ protein [Caminicella sporogenes DSM 14501]|uniref:Flagellar FliJ protein n=1 Tax=Caminicella sporogenes DSM 14501 TaxID=1121266 RepID=A0A1M6LCM4_9FIRM|nr:flagellar export protein FliJ [Caminicella sporogenes]RKD27787.1 flagellar export protein FliJ [Caminicella sporogenes]WIF94636.1 flagellar export protein FliJ [Caminicella sporogenes]SHJ68918.1 flagellar FliJ protein [Caminicella sporogenes DSM 14501]
MPVFKFRYQNILKLTEDKEMKLKGDLSKAYDELYLEKRKLDDLKSKRENVSKLLKDKTSRGCNIAVLKSINDYIKSLHFKIYIQRNRVAEKEKDIEIIKNKLFEMSKEKKILEKLKEKRYEEYKFHIKLEEDKLIDQIVTFNSKLSR